MNAPETLSFHVVQRQAPQAMLDALRSRFDQQFTTAAAICEQHGRDESPYPTTPPQAVVFCESTQDVADAVALAAQYQVPVIPFGTGSSLEGHLLAVQGGISLDVNRMNRVLNIHAEDLLVTVQPGVTREQLNRDIKDTGLFFPIDPGANASLGGMAATRASGTNAVRYGTMRENVLALEVVTASGSVIRTGTRAKKSSAGYDLTRLMVGSEGTLGVITEITLKLYPLPEAVSAAICHFPSEGAAVEATIQIIQLGIPIARCELLDANAVRAVNKHSHLNMREQPMLLMEFHGSPAGVAEQAQLVQDIAQPLGGEDFQWATTPEDRTKLWTARHKAYFAAMQMHPGSRTVTTDTCVPISKLAECVVAAKQEAEAAGLAHYIVGHVGDGNFHIAYMVDPANEAQCELAERLNERVVRRAIGVGGTCTGEHGIGLHKQGFLVEEAGEETVAMMRTLKCALDPLNILNPGKIFSL